MSINPKGSYRKQFVQAIQRVHQMMTLDQDLLRGKEVIASMQKAEARLTTIVK